MSNQNSAPENAIAQAKDGEITHYICQNGSELTERDFGRELGPPELLGSAKPNTPGAYLLLGEKRAFYCLSEGNFLQDFEYDDEEGEWAQGELAGSEAEAASGAGIAATIAADSRIYVFFQSPSRAIQSIHRDLDGEWQSSGDLPSTQPSDDLSIYAMAKDDAISLFYTNVDDYIHELVFDGKWTDNQVPLTHSTSRKHDIASTRADDGLYTLQFTNAEGELYAIHKGEKTLMGKYVNGVFDKDAQGWNYSGPKVVYK